MARLGNEFAGHALHVLKQHERRTDQLDDIHIAEWEFISHILSVANATNGKALAGWASTNQIHVPVERRETPSYRWVTQENLNVMASALDPRRPRAPGGISRPCLKKVGFESFESHRVFLDR